MSVRLSMVSSAQGGRHEVRAIPALFLALLLTAGLSAVRAADDLDVMSLEELVKVPVIQTPKFAINADFTPSLVSLVSRNDIRAFGWRTLGDALRSLNGFTVTSDHTYSYVGVRGVAAPGDYRSRLQLLIDGISVNENIYGSANIDSAFPMDMDLVEHIEIIHGPSASVYGGDSTFGVINVVTRSGGSFAGGEAAIGLGSGRLGEGRVTWGKTLEGGADVVLSYSGGYARGGDLSFPEFAAAGMDAAAQRVGGEQGRKLFARVKTDAWRATLIHSERTQIVPTGSYGTLFNSSAHTEADSFTLAEVGHDRQLSRENSWHSRIYVGQYRYQGDFPYDFPPYVLNRDRAKGEWWGLESRFLSTAWAGQRWIAGVEYKNNGKQHQVNDDLGYGCFGVGAAPCLDDSQQSRQLSVYAQDEITVGDTTYLTLGLRHDRMTAMPGHVSPRLGVVHQNSSGGVFKLLYATAFSDPSVYQRFYTTPTYLVGNPGLRPEHMRSLDLTWEQHLGANSRMSATLYHFRLQDLIGVSSATGLYENFSDVTGRGLEIEFQQHWRNRTMLRVGYALQQTTLAQGQLENMPRHALHGNLALPVPGSDWLLGLEGQALSRRAAGNAAGWVAGYGILNANLSYKPANRSWDLMLGVFNLFDRQYEDPVAADITLAGTRDRMTQLGRSLRLKLGLRF